ncbi:unnamed protein product [Nippostrongylus brasiliensis]|uniref:non-specific serine/threonine protein kinase n=1 Tax=Nippostrongylus brasiliensis TaxID=27835 RepID=A0A158R3K8_NIPBR|nr:unnamed protein product [Nippostrongylus brasiliensis]
MSWGTSLTKKLEHRNICGRNLKLQDFNPDFGSASMSDPAQTFIGTPFFMAPEVILAMDEGHYTEKADIWSLGITCIELAERRPPLFNMNAMSALYHIAQNDPPTLAPVTNENQPEWSEWFKDFVYICLRKEAKERPSTGVLLNHAFITRYEHRGIIQELISRTKAIVMELDNFQYRKMRKLMYLDEVENKEGENNQGGGCEEVDEVVTDSGMLSVEKECSAYNDNASAWRSQFFVASVPLRDDMATLKKSKFSTLRSAKLISREQEEYNKENNMYEQMNGYKRLRQLHHKDMQQERQRFKNVHQGEMEKKRKEVEEGEKKLRKQILARQAHEMRCFSNSQLKEYRHNKELAKSSLKERGLARSAYESALKDVKAQLTRQRTSAETAFEAKLRVELESELVKYRKAQLLMMHSLEKRLDEEELNVIERQMDNRHAMLRKHHETTKEMEVSHLRETQTMRKRHQIIQHEAESNNQTEYTRRKTEDLRKRHAIQSRQQPRELKLKEAQIRKQFRQAVKTQTRQFKLYQTQLMQAAPKEEHKEIAMQLKEKQKHRIALLTSQYEYQIESMVQEKTGKLESWQEEEARLLNERLSKELDDLRAYQAKQRAQLENTIDKERTALDERIALRQAMLEQRFAEEREDMQKQRDVRSRAIAERHAAEERQLAGVSANSSHTTAL